MTGRAALVLSGGGARRFQTQEASWHDKALAEINGKPLLVHAVENVLGVVDAVFVCVNAEDRLGTYRDVLEKHRLNVQFVVDEKADIYGPTVGIMSGLRAAKADYCLTVPCDMPFLKPSVADYLFTQADEFEVTVPMWPDGRLETLNMTIHRKAGLEITETLSSLKRSRSDDIIRGSAKTLLVSPLKEIKNLTPRDIFTGLAKVNKMLNLPHTIHLHTNNLGVPGNYKTTLETMQALEPLYTGDKPIAHITHIHFASFAGDSWAHFKSGAEEISKYLNNHNHMTVDIGQVTFSDTTTMTADGPFEFSLYELGGHYKWVNSDIETETSGGIIPFHFKKKSPVNALQWSIGLELSLLIKDPWKMYMTTDHPNGGPFTHYPRVLAWLMSRKAREATLKKCHKRAQKKSLLPTIDREYSLYELAIITRAGTAKALGLKNKGHLGVGADADVAIFNINPETTDISQQYKSVRKAFANAAYTIKDGQIVVKDAEIVATPSGRTMWLDVQTKEPCRISDEMKKKFKDYWTVEFDNYPVTDHYVKVPEKIAIKASV